MAHTVERRMQIEHNISLTKKNPRCRTKARDAANILLDIDAIVWQSVVPVEASIDYIIAIHFTCRFLCIQIFWQAPKDACVYFVLCACLWSFKVVYFGTGRNRLKPST